jgi:hypothetical protein
VRGVDVTRPVRKEVASANFRRDIALTHVGALCRRQPLGKAARWLDAIEVHIGTRTDQVAQTVTADAQPVDLLETARPVGQERLTRPRFGGERLSALLLPGRAIGLHRHVGQRVIAIVRQQLDLVHGPIIGGRPLAAERSVDAEIAVRWTIQLHRIGLQRMRGELLDIDRDRRRQSLWTQHIIAQRPAIGTAAQRQLMPHTSFVRGHQW